MTTINDDEYELMASISVGARTSSVPHDDWVLRQGLRLRGYLKRTYDPVWPDEITETGEQAVYDYRLHQFNA